MNELVPPREGIIGKSPSNLSNPSTPTRLHVPSSYSRKALRGLAHTLKDFVNMPAINLRRRTHSDPPSTPRPAAPQEPAVVAYTDGACIGNPGPGGWGVHIQYPDGRIVDLGGGEEFSTNNRMELRAAIEAVRATLDEPAVTIVTDSQ